MINKSKIVKDAQKFVAKGQLDKAIVEYCKITAATPNDSNTHNTIGDLYIKLGNKAKAVESFKSAADILNKDGFALKAIALYKKVLNLNPEQVDVQMQMGKLNAERGMLGNANENYMAAISYFNKHGKRDKALEVYKILCNLNPTNITLAQKLADLYMSEGLFSEGVSKLLDLADLKLSEGDINEAKHFLEKAKSKGSDRQDFIRVAAEINLKEGRIPEAMEALEKLRDMDPGDTRILALLSDSYIHAGKYEDAASTVEDLLEAQPGNAEYRRKLIDINIKCGDFEAAWQNYRDQVDIHIDKKEYNKAQKLIQEYLELNPESIEARQVLADMYTSIGREDRIAELHAEMAELYAKGGESEKAINIYTKLLEQSPGNKEYSSAITRIKSGEAVPPPPKPEVKPEPEPEPVSQTAGLAEEQPAPAQEEDFGGFIEKPQPAQQHPDVSTEEPEPVSEYTAEPPPIEQSTGMEFLSQFAGEGAFEQPSEEPEPPKEEGGPVYDLSGMSDELPPLDLGAGTDEDVFPGEESPSGSYEVTEEASTDMDFLGQLSGEAPALPSEGSGHEQPESAFVEQEHAVNESQFGVYEITEGDETGLAGVDIFGKSGIEPEEETPEEEWKPADAAAYDISGLEPSTGLEPPADEAETTGYKVPAYQETSSFDESLTEADVYIKYGLFPKAVEVLSSLELANPSNPELLLRFIDICKAQNEMDCFVERSIQLAVVYKNRDMDNEAKAIIDRALKLSPNDERLKLYLGEPVSSPTPAASQETSIADIDDTSFAETEEIPVNETVEETSFEEAFKTTGAGPVEEPISSPDSIAISEELAEADFYAGQELYNEAKAIYRRLLAADPENDELWEKYNAVVAAAQKPAPAPKAAPVVEESSFADIAETEPEPAEDVEEPVAAEMDNEFDEAFKEIDLEAEEPAESVELHEEAVPVEEEPVLVEEAVEEAAEDASEDDFFDLAAELRDEMGTEIISPVVSSSSFADSSLEEVFQEFRKGVNEQIGGEDYETHYNLGIAYKEMGMIDEALSEFIEASKDPARKLDCASMIGLCHLEKGEYKKAIEQFKRGLEVKGRAKEEYFGIKYDMATAYELSGDPVSAFASISEICKDNREFRDVMKRYTRLEKAAAAASTPATDSDGGDTTDGKNKKSRVSYL